MEKKISVDEATKLLIHTSFFDSKHLFDSLSKTVENTLNIDFKSRFRDTERSALTYYWFILTLSSNLIAIKNIEGNNYKVLYRSLVKNIKRFFEEDKKTSDRVIKLMLELFNEMSTASNPLGVPIDYLERYFPTQFRTEGQLIMDQIILTYHTSFGGMWKEIKDTYKLSFKNEKQGNYLTDWLFGKTIAAISFIVVIILFSFTFRGDLLDVFDDKSTQSNHNAEEINDSNNNSVQSNYNAEEINGTNDSIEVSDTTYAFVENNKEQFTDALMEYTNRSISDMSVDELNSDIFVILVKDFEVNEEDAYSISEELSQIIDNEY